MRSPANRRVPDRTDLATLGCRRFPARRDPSERPAQLSHDLAHRDPQAHRVHRCSPGCPAAIAACRVRQAASRYRACQPKARCSDDPATWVNQGQCGRCRQADHPAAFPFQGHLASPYRDGPAVQPDLDDPAGSPFQGSAVHPFRIDLVGGSRPCPELTAFRSGQESAVSSRDPRRVERR